ncbi:hypothetical protein GUJ93_ZPchr0006g42791 [Zizania palustris]|uniref:Uncharacterized protein n=1 Tax=Zizania palustris TaxID=103762 RepID=A0A8J5TCU8_ZIZPA|nr:hypothetical protein GUJ93_ZPchr0006g42791 [Zizania palustris]
MHALLALTACSSGEGHPEDEAGAPQGCGGIHGLLSLPAGKMVVTDLGCSSGPNTFLVVSQVLAAVANCCGEQPAAAADVIQLQFFLNDLPSNDFNHVFQSVEPFNKLTAKEMGEAAPPYYIAALPGSFYTRLFPDHTVHLFHSSYSLMWRSKVPDELATGAVMNAGNMYIWETTPPAVVKLYQELFQKDFSLFLKLRYSELVSGGQMVLTFMGRKKSDVLSLSGEGSCMFQLLAQAFQSLVQLGRVEEEKLDTFNLPFYTPSMEEVKAVVRQSELFDINHIELFESNWDPLEDDDDDNDDLQVVDSVRSGVNVAKCIRAGLEPLVALHFGGCIVDDLFEMYAHSVAKHLEKLKANDRWFVLSWGRRCWQAAATNRASAALPCGQIRPLLGTWVLVFYAPSTEEVKAVVMSSELFDVNHAELFESNWDRSQEDDDDDNDLQLQAVDSVIGVRSGVNR